jgi:mRNA interferase MazF
MKTHSAIYERFDIVVVPFPFTDRESTKRRPALVLSSELELQSRIGHSVLAMITSKDTPPWPNDILIEEWDEAGLPNPSKVRMKIFTLDDRLILEKLGTLSEGDQKTVSKTLKKTLGF